MYRKVLPGVFWVGLYQGEGGGSQGWWKLRGGGGQGVRLYMTERIQ